MAFDAKSRTPVLEAQIQKKFFNQYEIMMNKGCEKTWPGITHRRYSMDKGNVQ